MSKIIPPLLSTTPPPIVLDDNEDEFGDFNVASIDLPSGCDSFPLPIETKSVEKDFQDRRKTEADLIETDYNISKIQVTSKFSTFQYFPDVPPDDDHFEVEFNDDPLEISSSQSRLQEPEIPESTPAHLEKPEIPDSTQAHLEDLEVPDSTQSYLEEPDVIQVLASSVVINNFGEGYFENTFDGAEDTQDWANACSGISKIKIADETRLSDDDEFGCFASSDVGPIEKSGEIESETRAEDDFGDFNNYATEDLVTFTDFEHLQSFIDDIFPNSEREDMPEYQAQDVTSNDYVFNQLKDIADTNAVTFQWSKSKCQGLLLKALNIDMRNILYGPRWNESMPRYAATLGFTPLEPTKTEVTSTIKEPAQTSTIKEPAQTSTIKEPAQTCTQTSESSAQPTSEIPSAQFDWVGSGLTNPLEITPKESLEKKESETVTTPTGNKKFTFLPSTSQGPDRESVKSQRLETEASNVEDDFEDFTSYQEDKGTNWQDRCIPLRETHIANQDCETTRAADDPSWLKPMIVTPVLCRKEETHTHFTKNELDSWLQDQTSLHEGPTTPEFASFTTTHSSQTNHLPSESVPEKPTNDEDDEFSDFQSVQPQPVEVAPLAPVILQPVKVTNASTVIEWPDPGITDDDLKRLEMLYQPVQSNSADEDEWSDFVSNQTPADEAKKPEVQNSIKLEPKSSQNGVHTDETDIEDEWSDFVSGPPVLPNGIMPVPKIHIDLNRPPQFTSWTSNFTPNIITNPVAFESFQPVQQIDLLKNRTPVKKTLRTKNNTIPSISSIPDLEFIVPKSHTWKK